MILKAQLKALRANCQAMVVIVDSMLGDEVMESELPTGCTHPESQLIDCKVMGSPNQKKCQQCGVLVNRVKTEEGG